MTSANRLIATCALALGLAACGGDDADDDPVCGDDICASTESAATCAVDCGCGNGVVNPGESCDGADLDGATCESEGQGPGTLACSNDCSFDVSGCDVTTCGNDLAEEGEGCDGTDLRDMTCESLGFSAGAVTCDSGCSYDVSGCCNDFCDTDGAASCADDTLHVCTLEASGCLALEVTDCTAVADVCDDSGETAMCVCVDRCPAEGAAHCTGDVAETCVVGGDGCLDWVPTTDCSLTGQTCAIGPQGSTCVVDATGEDCTDPYPLTDGLNVIAWTATSSDYLTAQPSCNTSTLTGPDVVLGYTAQVDGIVTFAMDKPASARQVMVASSAACGTITPEAACVADSAPTTQGSTFAVTTGTTYYFYVRDTTSGTAPLDNPLVVDLNEVACTSFTNAATSLSPASGSTLATANPVLSVSLEHPVNTASGVITITGSLGTSLSYDLSTTPAEVTFSNGDRTITIDPAAALVPGETVSVAWTGLVDKFCAVPVPPPTWQFSILTPSCSPGTGGMLGTTTARIATGTGSFTEYYVAADTDPSGYVYVGGLSDLFRIPKAGGAFEDVVAAAGITSTELGYNMAIAGSSIFTMDSTTSTTSSFLWRLSTSNGVTWNPLGYAAWPTGPGDSAKGIFVDGGRMYILIDEISANTPTAIWSVSSSAVVLPEDAVLEGSVAGEGDCDAISGDADYFYLTCSDGDRIVRVDRATFVSELITDAIDLSTSRNAVHAHDTDADGTADVLYVQADAERVHYVCSPAGVAPFWADLLVEFGTGTSNHGLGFDPVNKKLWAYDDDTQELVSIE